MRGRWIVALVAVLGATAGCGFVGPSGDPFEGGVERVPGPGYVHLVATPERAPRRIELRYFSPGDGQLSTAADAFDTGQTISVGRWNLPGPMGVAVDGVPCGGSFAVLAGLQTSVQLILAEHGCRVIAAGTGEPIPTPAGQ